MKNTYSSNHYSIFFILLNSFYTCFKGNFGNFDVRPSKNEINAYQAFLRVNCKKRGFDSNKKWRGAKAETELMST